MISPLNYCGRMAELVDAPDLGVSAHHQKSEECRIFRTLLNPHDPTVSLSDTFGEPEWKNPLAQRKGRRQSNAKSGKERGSLGGVALVGQRGAAGDAGALGEQVVPMKHTFRRNVIALLKTAPWRCLVDPRFLVRVIAVSWRLRS